jgi:hypothetical protein
MGLAAARAGLDVLLVELEGHSDLGSPFGFHTLPYRANLLEEVDGGGRLRGRQITPDRALQEYLDRSGLALISNRLARSGAVEVIAAAAPGIRDLLALGKIRQLEERNDADLIVVDAPAAGHAITFLQSPAGLAATAESGPIRQQAELVLEMFADPARCQVVLVTTPEEAPITEVMETAFSVEDLVGLQLGPVVVNSCWPDIDGLAEAVARRIDRTGPAERAARFRLDRIAAQRNEIDRLRDGLPLPQVELPYLFTTSIGRDKIDDLASVLTASLDGGFA